MTAGRGLLALLLTTTVLAPAPATTGQDATDAPRPTPTAQTDVPEPPAEVVAWFAEEGAEAAGSADLGAVEDLAVGVPRQVAEWNEAYIAGEEAEVLAEPVDEWVAPVLLRSEDSPDPVGVVHVGADDGANPELLTVTDDADLAGALHTVPGAATFVRDTGVEGWFAAQDGEVWPLTEGARTVLQGSLPADVFQEFLAAWRGQSPPTAVPDPEEAAEGTLSPLIPIGVIIVVGAAAAWLLVRQYRRADSRIAADVHAGIAPPREDGDMLRPDGGGERTGG